ncbi:hypothetical protein B0H16DRAFT_707274 [Mycena metata]|uniref:Uncharacterized protein n=1 Tax=Mycena metata TaxID=1033252 RepID=A0AAD7ND63_9AGAR|nr:hypothetical protein B0H16DRAFT_707274 [Mycena metata]
MPAFAFAYGSFGDILATGQLIVKIIVILRKGTRSDECAETEKELKSLGGDLANLTLMPVDDAVQASPLAQSVADRVQEEIRRCHRLMVHFFSKMNATSGLFQRLMWAVSEERELATFRMRIIERRTALGVVVGMLNSGMLLAVQDRVVERYTQTQDTVVNGVSSLAQQLATYQQQIVAVVRQVSRSVAEDLFVVISPTGVSIPVPLAYCGTFLALVPILDAYFKSQTDRQDIPYWWIITTSDGSEPLEHWHPTASIKLSLVSRPRVENLLLADVWYRNQCAWCGNPFAILSEQSLQCQIRPNSRCESLAQLFGQVVSWEVFLSRLVMLSSPSANFLCDHLATPSRRWIIEQPLSGAQAPWGPCGITRRRGGVSMGSS